MSEPTKPTATVATAKTSESFAQFMDDAWEKALAEGRKIEGKIVAVGEQIVEEGFVDFEQALEIGMPVALAAVVAEAPKEISGEEKMGNVVTAVTQAVEAKLGPVVIADMQTIGNIAYRGAQKIASGG